MFFDEVRDFDVPQRNVSYIPLQQPVSNSHLASFL